MSEVKTNEPVKQEGDFKIKSKPKKPKQLGNKEQEITKVNLKEPLVDVEPNVTKVEIKKEEVKQEDDAIQIGETKEVSVEKPSGDSTKVGEPVQESNETTEGFSPIQEVTEAEVKEVEAEVKEAIRDEKVLGKQLPENVEKLVSFMEETGGTVEDYVRLNADYSNVDNDTLLKEYYKQEKSHLNSEEINFMMEDNFSFDAEVDEEREIRKKKLAYKEEVAKARKHLEGLKSKYYEEIKLRPGVTQDQQKAMDFFNRYNQEQETAQEQHERFKSNTKDYFSKEFKGFDFNVGEKKFRYGVKNPDAVAEKQSNITNVIKKFLNDKGDVTDVKGYHKAMYAAENVDTIAQHFYEQGKADAIRDVAAKSKNVQTEVRESPTGDVFVNGLKVKAVSGLDSSKLKIKTRKFN